VRGRYQVSAPFEFGQAGLGACSTQGVHCLRVAHVDVLARDPHAWACTASSLCKLTFNT
jgi:hypothetical protein